MIDTASNTKYDKSKLGYFHRGSVHQRDDVIAIFHIDPMPLAFTYYGLREQ
jgi:hypothetical protein